MMEDGVDELLKHYENEKERIENLSFFEECKNIEGFPKDDMVYVINPIGLVGAFEYMSKKPQWIIIAEKELGTKEIKGTKHNQRILDYHNVSGGFSTDEIPWCGSFVNWVMKQSNYTTVSSPARAKSWKTFGKAIKKPVFGAIAVKDREGGGHVGFVVGKSADDKYLYILGGNQNDSVNISKYKLSVWTDYRVPIDYMTTDYLPIYEGISNNSGRES